MIKVFFAECTKENEHETGIKLAEAAFLDVYGRCAVISHENSGKPCFENEPCVFVSISHSKGRCAVALSDAPVGIDIEYMDENPRLLDMANRFFTKEEAEYVSADVNGRFYEVWCKKESFMKYTGEGFSRPMSSFSVLSDGMVYSFFTKDGYALAVCSKEKADHSHVNINN